jgi:hypothetical protein
MDVMNTAGGRRLVAGAEVAVDAEVRHGGNRSLRVKFTGTDNVGFHHVWQDAVVEPGVWKLQAYAKTAGVTTDQGAKLVVVNPRSGGKVLAESAPMLGDAAWQKVELVFPVAPGSDLVRIQLKRDPSRKFDSKIRGSVWLDDCRLEPAGAPPRR